RIVGEAANGEQALSLIEQVQPDIVITDVVMPVTDGIELIKEIKAKYPTIEIVVLSSFEDFEYVRSSFQFGVADKRSALTFERDNASSFKRLNGLWKFSYATSPSLAPEDFYETDYDASSWDDLYVPSSWQMH